MGGVWLCVWLYGLHGNLHWRGNRAVGLSDRERKSACRTNWALKGKGRDEFYIFATKIKKYDIPLCDRASPMSKNYQSFSVCVLTTLSYVQ